MLVKQAKDTARQWALEEAFKIPGFSGAYFHGSTAGLPDNAPFPATSDVDVMVVLADANPQQKLGKFIYQGVLLEVSFISTDQLATPEIILSRYHLAGSFRTASVILDPSGHLSKLQAVVAKEFARREWVYKRCEDARSNLLRFLRGINADAPFYDQAVSWLFANGVTTHILLVAGLKNPTVRKRYAAARELLAEYGRLDFYEGLLELLGCARMSRASVERHLAAMTTAFDAAKLLDKTPFFYASDISDAARPIAVEGSRDLIGQGLHREAVFWIAATYSRCQAIFHHAASAEMQEKFAIGYRNLFADLGISSFADIQRRGEQVSASLPAVWEMAEEIIAANPATEE